LTNSNAEVSRVASLALAVRLGENLHAVPIDAVEEVLPALPIETVPECPAFVRGVVFVRGHLIPVLDAAERLGIKDHQRPPEPHIVCLRIGGRLVGVEFDEALDLLELHEIQSLSAHDVGAKSGFFAGVLEQDGQIIRLLDPEKLMASDEAERLQQVPHTA
jgi:purine-binding chemotaxis protein CheW